MGPPEGGQDAFHHGSITTAGPVRLSDATWAVEADGFSNANE